MRLAKILLVSTILALAVGFTSCMQRTNTTNIRGTVTFEKKPVVGAEVRLTGKTAEDITRTNHDGRYSLSVKHRPAEKLEVTVLWPGYTHDKIEFQAFRSDDKPIDIELKKVFTPSAPSR